ncbi:MAG: bifunctional oligoribonuclease/PAP phosphatase NrnA [candidate division Zixibacteria bacterium]|nr:bifunctional oligoribonuclease/PAP phosphatase NrnA [candidate division Zixibacteria bacterium]
MKSKMTKTDSTQQVFSTLPSAEIKQIIERSHSVLIVSHIDPDGDAIGTQLAFAEYLRHLHKKVVLVRESEIPFKYRFLPDIENIVPIDTISADINIDTVVILECPNASRIGRAISLFGEHMTILNIDHHRDSGLLGTINWIEPERSSVGEMIYEYFSTIGFEISSNVAIQLYTAILTDTGRFRYPSTTPRTMQIAGELIKAGADPKTICNYVYYNLSPSTMKLTAKVLNTIEFYQDGSICFLTLTRNILNETGADMAESDGLVDFTLHTNGVIVGVLLKEQDDNHTRVSLRSRDGINVADIAAQYGGGGHFNASGCTIPKNLTATREELLHLLGEV